MYLVTPWSSQLTEPVVTSDVAVEAHAKRENVRKVMTEVLHFINEVEIKMWRSTVAMWTSFKKRCCEYSYDI
eukprot:5735424-Amphidinium_carterae.2